MVVWADVLCHGVRLAFFWCLLCMMCSLLQQYAAVARGFWWHLSGPTRPQAHCQLHYADLVIEIINFADSVPFIMCSFKIVMPRVDSVTL